MDQKTFITALRKVVREELKTVIKQELTEILQEGLKSTISEIAQPKTPIKATMSAAPTKAPRFAVSPVVAKVTPRTAVADATESIDTVDPAGLLEM